MRVVIALLLILVCLATAPRLLHEARKEYSIANPILVSLDPSNTVLLGVITEKSAAVTTLELMLREAAGVKDIYLILDSPGGEVDAGIWLAENVKAMNAQYHNNIHLVVKHAASMAAMLLELIPGERYIMPQAVLMFHNAAVQLQMQTAEHVDDIIKMLGELQKQLKITETEVAARMGLTWEQYHKAIENELWLHGNEIIEKDAADGIVTITCSKELIDLNACPI